MERVPAWLGFIEEFIVSLGDITSALALIVRGRQIPVVPAQPVVNIANEKETIATPATEKSRSSLYLKVSLPVLLLFGNIGHSFGAIFSGGSAKVETGDNLYKIVKQALSANGVDKYTNSQLSEIVNNIITSNHLTHPDLILPQDKLNGITEAIHQVFPNVQVHEAVSNTVGQVAQNLAQAHGSADGITHIATQHVQNMPVSHIGGQVADYHSFFQNVIDFAQIHFGPTAHAVQTWFSSVTNGEVSTIAATAVVASGHWRLHMVCPQGNKRSPYSKQSHN